MNATTGIACLLISKAHDRSRLTRSANPPSPSSILPFPFPPLHLPLQLLHCQRTPPTPPRPRLPLPPHPPLAAAQPHDQEPQRLPVHVEHLPPRHGGQLDAHFPRGEVDGRDGEGGGLVREVEELWGEEGGVEVGEGACGDGAAGIFLVLGGGTVVVVVDDVVGGGGGRGKQHAERLQVREGDGVRGCEVRGEGERAQD